MITLRRLHAEHFKGLQMVDLIFPEQGSILIEGHNEAGKSTLFEAVYVALYGEPLVGEESRPRLEEVIQHGQPQALVELNFAVGVEELTVRRILRRDQPQRAWLTIHRPDGSEETVTRPTTVNRRILQEFNNLDGDNLRNSCFVEQKELGRLEEMNSSKREQAIQSLLGLERLAKLSDQFKFKREQELDLDHTRRLLELAQVQQEVRTLEAEERALAERLDATRIFAHLAEYATLETERSTIQERFAARERHETDLRGSLDRAGRIRGQLSACGDVQQQLERAVAQRVDVERLSGKLAELYDVEHEAMPETRAKLDKTLLALKLVIDAEQTRETAQRAAVAVHDAQRAVEALERANEVVRQRVESLHAARARADQHRQDAESSRRQQQAHLAELVARQTRLHRALERVTLWEQQCATLEDIRREMQGTDQKARALADLRAVLRQREETAHQAADATASAERERQQAEAHRRQAEGRVALRDWLRLKEVDASLSGFARDRATLEDERGKAADALLRAQGQTRGSLVAAAATTLVAVLMFAASAAWTWVAIVGGILAIAAVLLWVGYRRAHARMGASKKAADSVENQLRDLATQYQAAVRAGGDPALLGQRERELAAAGFEVPSSLEAARAMLRRMPSEDAFDYQRARAAADDAMATLARLKAEAERAQAEAGQTREALRALEAQGDAATLLRDLRAREIAQRETVEAAEADARDAVVANLSWPANSAHVQTAIAACQAEQRAVERGMAAAETTMANGARDDASLLAQAEQALKTAEDAAAALRTPDPLEKLAQIQAHLVRTEELAVEAGTRARLAAQDIGLAPNRAAVEAERGRLEERLHILEGQLISRPALDAEL
ncbi:MAG TPA: AAA family ATPase, partial [Ktedonobacterales bacterium]